MSTQLRLDGLLAKVESTYGTDSAPANATDGVRVSERVWSTLRLEHAFPGTRDGVANGSLIPPAQPAIPAGRMVTLDIAWEARGAGAAYAAAVRPEADALLRACGFASTVDATVGAENVAYSIADSGHESATIYAYAAGNVYKIIGCRGNVVWPVTAGENGILRFQMQGILSAEPDAAALPSITYDAVVPAVAKGMTVTIGAWSPDLLEAEFDAGISVQRLDSATAADVVAQFAVAEAIPSLSISARTVALATHDPYTDASTPTSKAAAVELGGTQYNRIKLADAAAWGSYPEHIEDQGFTGWRIGYRLTDPTITFD